jgi:hypothetical protein
MYAISKTKRKYSPTPIVKILPNGQEQIVLLIANMSKDEGDRFAEYVVERLNKKS